MGAALTLLAVLGSCDSSEPVSPVGSFCAAADQLFNHSTFAPDGEGVVAALRGLDVDGVAPADRGPWRAAIGRIETTIAEFRGGAAPDGWSTEPAATLAARICDREMQVFVVMP